MTNVRCSGRSSVMLHAMECARPSEGQQRIVAQCTPAPLKAICEACAACGDVRAERALDRSDDRSRMQDGLDIHTGAVCLRPPVTWLTARGTSLSRRAGVRGLLCSFFARVAAATNCVEFRWIPCRSPYERSQAVSTQHAHWRVRQSCAKQCHVSSFEAQAMLAKRL
jgi:hypothetical protein